VGKKSVVGNMTLTEFLQFLICRVRSSDAEKAELDKGFFNVRGWIQAAGKVLGDPKI
jgi:hypothetical protein